MTVDAVVDSSFSIVERVVITDVASPIIHLVAPEVYIDVIIAIVYAILVSFGSS